LITLIINAHSALGSTDPDLSFEARTGGTLIRKTSLQDRTDNPLRSSKRLTKHLHATPCGTTRTCRERVPAAIFRSRSILGTIFSSRCQIPRIRRMPCGQARKSIMQSKANLFFSDET